MNCANFKDTHVFHGKDTLIVVTFSSWLCCRSNNFYKHSRSRITAPKARNCMVLKKFVKVQLCFYGSVC